MQQISPGFWRIDEIGDGANCYVWAWGQGITLIDVGGAKSAATVLGALTRAGWPLHKVRRILVTHADGDQVGALAAIQRATGARVLCHEAEEPYLAQLHQRRRVWYLWPVVALSDLLTRGRLTAVTPDGLLVDGQTTPEGFTVIHTPGHTPGHISLLHRERRLLVAGDALSNRRGRLMPPPAMTTADPAEAMRSILKLAKRYGSSFEVVVFAHGPPILQNGGKRIQAFASQAFSEEI